MREITYEGKVYKTVYELCSELNINYRALQYRLDRAFTVEEAVQKLLEDTEGTGILVYALTFRDTKEIASHFGVNLVKLNRRIFDLNMEVREAIEDLYEQKMELDGYTFQSFNDLCCAYEKNPETIFGLIKRGKNLAESLAHIPMPSLEKKGRYTHVTFSERRLACERAGILVSTVNALSKREEIEWQEAYELIVSFLDTLGGNRPDRLKSMPTVIYNNTWYLSTEDFCKACGVGLGEYLTFRKTESFETHLASMEKLKETQRHYYQYKGNPTLYTSLAELSAANDNCSAFREKRNGNIVRTSGPRYKGCTYEPTGYTVDAKQALTEFITKYLEENKQEQYY